MPEEFWSTVRRRRFSSPIRRSSDSRRCTVLGGWWQHRPHVTQSPPRGSGSPSMGVKFEKGLGVASGGTRFGMA